MAKAKNPVTSEAQTQEIAQNSKDSRWNSRKNTANKNGCIESTQETEIYNSKNKPKKKEITYH